MRLRLIAEAGIEINVAREFLNSRRSGLGELFVAEVERGFDAIVQAGESLPLMETLSASAGYHRYNLSKFRYSIIFRRRADSLVVVAICHTSRKPNYWLGRGLEPE